MQCSFIFHQSAGDSITASVKASTMIYFAKSHLSNLEP